MMGIVYSLNPFEEAMRNAEAVAWHGQDIPENAKIGRNPNSRELIEVLDKISIGDLDTDAKSSVSVNAKGGFIYVAYPFWDKSDTEYPLSLNGDIEAIIELVEELSVRCGTFMLTANGESPIFIDKRFDKGVDGYHARPLSK
jgi:hypothetical protein